MRRKYNLSKISAGLALIMVLAVGGCAKTPNGSIGDDAEYFLWVTLENNLFADKDFLWVRFHGDNVTPTGGEVFVDDKRVHLDPAAIETTHEFAGDQWVANTWIQILAVDSTGTVVYKDSVKIPQEFSITNIDPFNQPWRPGQPSPRIEWETSSNAVGFAISVKPPAGSDALGYAEYDESQTNLTETFTQEVFSNSFDFIRNGDYRVQVIAYNPNFIPRDNADFMSPEFDNIPQPISTTVVTGAISALTVTDAETITVETFN